MWRRVDIEEHIASIFRVEKFANEEAVRAGDSTAHAGSSLADFSTLKMEAICSSESSIHTRSTQRHIPDDGILHSHRSENLKSYLDT
jgi:hypothetical protein